MSNLKNIFDLFIGKDDERRDLSRLFVVEEKTYASNAMVLVRCDNDKIDFDFEAALNPPNISHLNFHKNITSEICLDHIDLDSLMCEDEYEDFEEDCGHCAGHGRCDDYLLYDEKWYEYSFECPVCEGDGLIDKGRKFTGRKVFPKENYFKVLDAYIDANNFVVLKKVSGLINEHVTLVGYYGKDKEVVFQIGFLEILIMPAINVPTSNIIAAYP